MAGNNVQQGSSGGEHVVQHHETRRSVEAIVTSVVWFITGVIAVLLASRFFLLLFGANPRAGFTRFVYGFAAPLMAPFEAVFGRTRIQGATFDVNTLLAIAVYVLIGWGITALIRVVTPRTGARTVESVEEVERGETRSTTGRQ